MHELTEMTLQEALQALQNRQVSSRELTQAYIYRIEKYNPILNAFLFTNADEALRKAEAADIRRKKEDKDNLPPLLGLPIAVKDVLTVDGMPATAGSRILENFKPP